MGLVNNTRKTSARLALLKERVIHDEMTRDSLVMVIAGLLGGVFSYLYQLFMGKLLPPADFGTVFTLTSLFLVVSWISQSVQTPMTRFVSMFKAQGSLGKANYVWKSSLKLGLVIGLTLFILFAAAIPLLSRFLNIHNSLYLLLLFSSFILAAGLPVNYGVLGGLQRFIPLSFSTALWSFLRFAIGALAVYLGLGIYGALAPFILASIITFALTLYFLRGLVKITNEKVALREFGSYTGFALLAVSCIAVIMNIDILLAKHYLSAESVGDYAAISVLGKIAFYASAGIALAMFPKTSELFEKKGRHKPIVRKAVLYTLLISGVVVLVYLVAPQFVANFVFGGKYPLLPDYLFKYGLAMLLFVLAYILANYSLSLNRAKGVALFLLGITLLEVVLLLIFHQSIAQFVNIVMLVSGVSLLLMLILYWAGDRSPRRRVAP